LLLNTGFKVCELHYMKIYLKDNEDEP
jgi:hypothetical protein